MMRTPIKTAAGLLPLALMVAVPQGPAYAEDIAVDATIDAVTLFRSGAEVTRIFTLALEPGEHELLVSLPRAVQRNSIQIEETGGEDIAIRALDIALEPRDEEAEDTTRRRLQGRIDALEAEIEKQETVIADARFSRSLVETLALRKLQPTGPETSPSLPTPDELSGLLDTVDARLAANTATVLDARTKIKDANAQIQDLREEMEQVGADGERAYVGTFHIFVPAATSAAFELRYRLGDASWQPFYQAHLDTGSTANGAALEFARNAAITQTTDEEWADVSLTLSTAQGTQSVAAPTLAPQSLAEFRRQNAETAQPSGYASSDPLVADAETGQAAPAATGFNAVYEIPNRVSLANNGEAKYIQIDESTHPAELHLEAVPKVDLTAYLVARFLPTTSTPLLPGQTMLFRDGVFIGEDPLPLTAPGEPVELDFGADDLISIERSELKRTSGETGLVSSTYVDERSYLTRISNSHDFPLDIVVTDQVPVSGDERIRVELMPGTKRPDDDDMSETKGIVTWTETLDPGETTEIPFSFRVVWPKAMSR